MFSEDGLRITGTTLEGECEQNDYADFGGGYDIEINSNDILRVCTEISSDCAKKSLFCLTLKFSLFSTLRSPLIPGQLNYFLMMFRARNGVLKHFSLIFW